MVTERTSRAEGGGTGRGALARRHGIVGRRAAVAGFLVVAVGLGLVFSGCEPGAGRDAPAKTPPAPSPGPARQPDEAAAPSPERLLALLGRRIGNLQREYDAVAAAAKEEQIAYQILRRQGYAEDAPECRRLVVRQKGYRQAVVTLTQTLDEARRLESRLLDVIDRGRARGVGGGMDPRLRDEVRRCLHRHEPVFDPEAVIPDEQWAGGSDVYMRGRWNAPGEEGTAKAAPK